MLDPARLLMLAFFVFWIGGTLLFSELRWFRRASLTRRLEAFSGSAVSLSPRPTFTSFRTALAPVASTLAERVARLFGLDDDLATRLRRAHLQVETTAFRMRQLAWTGAALGFVTLLSVAFRLPYELSLLFLLGAPLLAFLVLEQSVIIAAERRQRRMFAELPVFSEQLAMLFGAGFSLGSALNRLSQRGGGVIVEDLKVVCDRTSHGLNTSQALQEWAETARLPELDRLVVVLSVSSETSDIGRLVSEEARSIRREVQRRMAETIDRRAQQVWVPVTVATLIPGVIFLIIPFLQALQLFSNA